MGLDMKIATVGDHVIARYQKDRTWVNIEMTVKDKTGVGVPDQRYFDGIINERQLYQLATEKGWDMTSLENSQIIGLMYSNKANHLFMKGGLREGNLDALYDAASLGMYFYPNDWMLAENWRNINKHLGFRSQRRQLQTIKDQIAVLEGRGPFDIDFNDPSFKNPLIMKSDPFAGGFHGRQEHMKLLEKCIKQASSGYGDPRYVSMLPKMKNKLEEMKMYPHGDGPTDQKLKTLKQQQSYLQDKIDRQNRKSEALKMIYQTGSTIRRKNTK